MQTNPLFQVHNSSDDNDEEGEGQHCAAVDGSFSLSLSPCRLSLSVFVWKVLLAQLAISDSYSSEQLYTFAQAFLFHCVIGFKIDGKEKKCTENKVSFFYLCWDQKLGPFSCLFLILNGKLNN